MRREERPPHHLACEDEPQYRALLGRLHEIHDQRHVGQIGVLGERELHEQPDGAVVHPLRMATLDARP